MAGFNYTFGGMLVEPAQLSYLAYNFPIATLTPNQLQLNWPVSFIDSLYIAADILDITTSAGGQSMVIPPANQVSNGQQILINNLGAFPLAVYLNDGVTLLLNVPAGTSWLIYLTNNTTINIIGPTTYYIGTWRTVPFAGGLAGVVTSVAAVSTSPTQLIITGSPITNNGTFTFTLGADLLALTSFGAGTGYVVHTGVGTYALRTIVPVNANIAITNGNGVAGNTAVGLNNILVGLTSIGVGNLSLAGNIISSTNLNGNIGFVPNGTGVTQSASNFQVINGMSLQLFNAANTFYDALTAPAALAQNNTWSLPLTDGVAGSFLSTNGAGALAFTALNLATIPGRNIIINGDFELWQRGTTFVITNGSTIYGPDRWQPYVAIGGATNATISQQPGATSGRFFCRVQRNNGDAGNDGISINSSLTRDMCIGVAGNQLTFSFTARAGANYSPTGNIIRARIWTGTGNADISYLSGYTGQVLFSDTTFILTNNFVRYSFTTAAVPANVTQFAAALLMVPTGVAGGADYFDVYDIQVEISAVQSPFDRQPLAVSIPRCQYFYSKSFALTTTPAQNVGVNTGEQSSNAELAGVNINETAFINFPVTMRALPSTITSYNPAAANVQVRNFSAGADCTATAVHYSNARGMTFRFTGTAGTNIADSCGVHWSADSELY